MTSLSLAYATCHYEFLDFGKSKTIIFSHSLGADYSMWEWVVQIIKSDFNIVLYDIRGQGKSTNSQKQITIEDLAKDVIQLLKSLCIDTPIIFCGLSMGGLIGQYLSLHYAEYFDSLILANTAAKIGNEEAWNTRIQEVSTRGMCSVLEQTAQRWFTSKFRETQDAEVSLILQRYQNSPVEGYCANCAAIRDVDFRYVLNKITLPTLIIAGREDIVTTVDDALFLQQNIKNSKLQILEAAHLSAVEAAAEFAESILYFK
ncbi:alpha/beta fold hydrolase [Elizabethkingia argentiflava]|uniref:Alpha/beta fold hydrolase n=1 Tax=Elizabethkingia argenteiflava TaxID=2681556 RepID=A0A845PW91_9FLAO|nr:alpha/beta fold hydrolase [Elizabethkingia argenteiflava]NAW51895.1 alpha/beta fold hydrolase [Elizabethkingia argenteiflava]